MIQGQKFIGLADFTFAPAERDKGDYDNLRNTFDVNKLKDRNLVYTHTFYVKRFFDVIRDIPKEFVVITHNGDTNVDESFIMPDNVIKWYSQNVNVVNPKIESIPIGIENDRWFKKIPKKELMSEKLKTKRQYKNLVYMNFNINTNPLKREEPYMILKNKPYITTDMQRNGYAFNHYLDNLYNHKYVVCPEGNGMDTHRFWETLYMGSIPIVVKNINNWFYNDLPVLFVNRWSDVNKELLHTMWNMFENGEWNIDKLNFEYWKNIIINDVQ